MKGVSESITFVILVALVFTTAAIVGPWVYNMATQRADAERNHTTTVTVCREAGYDFDTSYGTGGITWNFTDNLLYARIKNTGTVKLYGFWFELILNSTIIMHYDATPGTAKTSASPLRPGESAIIQANLTDNLSTYTLDSVMILNEPCPSASPSAAGL
jgi:FlaG/FlaF family flagellin (archaellin)